jgi:hypothetical protein
MAAAKKKTVAKVTVADKRSTRKKIASAKSAARDPLESGTVTGGNKAVNKTAREVTKNWSSAEWDMAGRPYKGHEGALKGAYDIMATKSQWGAGKVSAKTGESVKAISARIKVDRSKTAGRAKNVEAKLNKKAGKK